MTHEQKPEIVRLHLVKAYEQGKRAGMRDLPICDADWESEFLPEYRRGYEDGKKERATKS